MGLFQLLSSDGLWIIVMFLSAVWDLKQNIAFNYWCGVFSKMSTSSVNLHEIGAPETDINNF